MSGRIDCGTFRTTQELLSRPLSTLDELEHLLSVFDNHFTVLKELGDDDSDQKRLADHFEKATQCLTEGRGIVNLIRKTPSASGSCNTSDRIGRTLDSGAIRELVSWDKKCDYQLEALRKATLELSSKTKDDSNFQMRLMARKLKKRATPVESKGALSILKLDMKCAYVNEKLKIRRMIVEADNLECVFKETKVVILVGTTGAGKTLMINSLVNYLYGVQYEDKFRFRLVEKKDEVRERATGVDSEAESMTSYVTGYELRWREHFRSSCNILLIDAPGFGDTRGWERDQQTIIQIRNFFEDDRACIVDSACMVGFTIKSSDNRLTTAQKYSFDQVLQLFAKDMKENVSLFFTHGTEDNPNALECVTRHNIPYSFHCSVENSALYMDYNSLSKIYWDLNEKSLRKLTDHLNSSQSVSLRLTKEVLRDRNTLGNLLQNLKQNIDDSLTMLKNLEFCTESVLQLDESISRAIQTEVECKLERNVAQIVSFYNMNCMRCKVTCHRGCITLANYFCSAFNISGNCLSCEPRCSKNEHTKEDKEYRLVTSTLTRKVEDLLRDYGIQSEDPYAEYKLLEAMQKQFELRKSKLLNDIFKATDIMNKLDTIALKNDSVSHEEYIEFLIREERKSGRSREERDERINMLESLLAITKLVSYMRSLSCDEEVIQNNPNRNSDAFKSQVKDIWFGLNGGLEQRLDNKLRDVYMRLADSNDQFRQKFSFRVRKFFSISKHRDISQFEVIHRRPTNGEQ